MGERRKQTCPQSSQTYLAGRQLFFSLSFVEPLFPLSRKPEELIGTCYTKHFTFWNGSGDPGEPTKACSFHV